LPETQITLEQWFLTGVAPPGGVDNFTAGTRALTRPKAWKV